MTKLRSFRWGDYPELVVWALNVMYPYERDAKGLDTYIQNRNHCENRGKIWHDMATSQGMLVATKSWER